ncbi:hypothetical protein D3C86_2263500 [compost metagenome]
MKWLVSAALVIFMPAGRVGAIVAMVLSSARTTSTELALVCLMIEKKTASWPSMAA